MSQTVEICRLFCRDLKQPIRKKMFARRTVERTEIVSLQAGYLSVLLSRVPHSPRVRVSRPAVCSVKPPVLQDNICLSSVPRPKPLRMDPPLCQVHERIKALFPQQRRQSEDKSKIKRLLSHWIFQGIYSKYKNKYLQEPGTRKLPSYSSQ